jgi:non-specific serine/threonine protein kinase
VPKVTPRESAPSDAPLRLAVSPAGHLHDSAPAAEGVPVAEAEPTADDGLSAAARVRTRAAFARGTGTGLFHLGASEPATTTLAPALAFARDLGKAYVTRLCGLPDLEAERERAHVPPPGDDELARLAAGVPPMPGAEYVDAARLATWWTEIEAAFRSEIAAFPGSVQELLRERSALWNTVGRVCFHLAENPGDEEHPFAFLATYTSAVSKKARVAHAPLSRALAESSARGDRTALLSLLVPVQRAAERSPLVAELVESGDLYQPLAWTPAEAHRFLVDLPLMEAAGVTVRVPNWWRQARPPRPQVTVRVGGKAPGANLGQDALLDFDVGVTLDGEPLTAAEMKALMAAHDGLVLVRGKWIELDRERLREVLHHWQNVEREAGDGVSFLEGMRLLAGVRVPGTEGDGAPVDDEEAAGWQRVVAGDWLGQTLAGLRGPDGLGTAHPGAALQATLRPYQEVGVRWLWFAAQLRLGVCLADDMGLGKTVQVLAMLLLHQQKKAKGAPPSLLVVPASLIGNWQAEIEKFAPSLRVHVAHASARPAGARAGSATDAPSLDDVDVVIATYTGVVRLPWITAAPWSFVVVDEAQALKNPGARQTRAVKTLRAEMRVALTGTPVENRLGDLWSLFDFLQPGLLGSARAFTNFVKQLDKAEGGDRYAPLRKLVQPYLLRRLKTDPRVISDLPEKTELRAFCALARPQAALYQRAVQDLAAELNAAEGMKRKGVVLAYLMRFKQICNHPLHGGGAATGADEWPEADSGKLQRLRELGEEIAARQEKVLVFTQFREATGLLANFLAGVFGRRGLVLHGGTPVGERQKLVKRFQEDDDLPYFVLSVKAGGTGLNLTAASHVIHFDRWWNPAVENQATDRAFRLGQKRAVLVHKLIARGTVEEKIDALIESKQALARGLLANEAAAETLLTELSDDELLSLVQLDLGRASAEA